MMDREQTLLQFFQALSERDRLLIMGQLALTPRGVTELSNDLGIEQMALERHLQVLSKLGLTEELSDGRLTINHAGLNELRQTVFRQSGKPKKPKTEREKVLAAFFEDGKVTSMPVQHKRKLIVLRELLQDVEPGRTYQEKELNQLIAERYQDFCTVRRYWVDLGYMERHDGYYRLLPQSEWPVDEV